MTTKKDGGAAKEGTDNAATPDVPEMVPVEKIETEIKEDIKSLKKAIDDKEAKGEISAASESTLQALYEELKAARSDLAALRELGAREVPVAQIQDRWAKWLPW